MQIYCFKNMAGLFNSFEYKLLEKSDNMKKKISIVLTLMLAKGIKLRC